MRTTRRQQELAAVGGLSLLAITIAVGVSLSHGSAHSATAIAESPTTAAALNDIREGPAGRRIFVTGSAPTMTLELLRNAPIVAVVRTVPVAATVHWNSADNTEWRSGEMTHIPMIYTDQRVEVVRVLKGSLNREEVIRNVGGTVRDVTFDGEGLATLTRGDTNLVFLRWEESITKEGKERALMVYGQAGGMFNPETGGRWRNATSGVEFDEVEIGRP